MIIAIIQPCFVPWLGYFEQMAIADIFVYFDDVQYTKKDWRNSNQLKSQYGVKPIYVPVRNASTGILINQALISYGERWEDNILNKLNEWYKKAPYFAEVIELIKPIIYQKYEKLIDLNYALNGAICRYVGILTPIFYSSSIPRVSADKNGRILEICKHFSGVNVLYDGKSAQNFIDIELFSKNGINIVFQDYVQKTYSQLWGGFTPYMSVIDLIMNQGKHSLDIIVNQKEIDKIRFLGSHL
jgi:hypothetical protein